MRKRWCPDNERFLRYLPTHGGRCVESTQNSKKRIHGGSMGKQPGPDLHRGQPQAPAMLSLAQPPERSFEFASLLRSHHLRDGGVLAGPTDGRARIRSPDQKPQTSSRQFPEVPVEANTGSLFKTSPSKNHHPFTS